MIARIAILLCLIGTAQAQRRDESPVRFPYSFERGMNLHDSPERAPAGYVVGNSFNYDYFSDGTARSRLVTRIDEFLAGADTSINLMGNLRNSRKFQPRNWGLVAAGTRWFKRNNESTTYTELTVPAGVVSEGFDELNSVEFDGNLIIGGDISAMTIFDGDSLFRLIVPVFIDSAAGLGDTLTGGSLGLDTTYTYAYTFLTKQGYQSYRADTINVTTGGTALACSLHTFPLFPAEFSSSIDTANIIARLWYRSTDGGATGGFLAAQPRSQTTFIDSGQFNLDDTVNFPRYRRTESRGRFPISFFSQVWAAGQKREERSIYRLDEDIDLTESQWAITPSMPQKNENSIGKVLLAHNGGSGTNFIQSVFTQQTNGDWLIVAPGAAFKSNGVLAGDYLISRDTGSANFPVALVLAVLTEDEIVADGRPGSLLSVGNNIFLVDDEYFGVGFALGSLWFIGRNSVGAGDVVRGLFGSVAATHTSGTPIFRVDNLSAANSSTRYVLHSEAFNPLQQQTQDPIEIPIDDITGLFKGNGYVGVTGPASVQQIRGTDIPTVHSMIENIGNMAPPALVPYQNGAFILDRRGEYYIDENGFEFLSENLGTAMFDSARAGFYSKASAYYHDGMLYVSIVDDANLNTDVWVADMTRKVDGNFPWTRYTGWSPKSWQSWLGSNNDYDLYFGAWDTAAVYKVSEFRNFDHDVDGNEVAVTSQVLTPRYFTDGSWTHWNWASLNIDTRDSVRVDAIISTRIGNGAGVHDFYEKNLLVLSPAAGDTSAARSIMSYRVEIEADGFSCQLRIWKSGTKGTTLFPGAIHGVARGL